MAHTLYEEFGQSRIPLIVEQMKSICDTMEAQGIMYWIDRGTLLGACRNGQWMVDDKDFDVCFLRSDFDAVQTICEANANFKTIVHNFEIDSMIRLFWMETPEQVFSNEYLYVDMYPHIIDSDGMVMEDTNRGRSTGGIFATRKFNRSFIDTMTSINYCGHGFKCPSDLVNFISGTHRYGTSWQTEENEGSLTKSLSLSIHT